METRYKKFTNKKIASIDLNKDKDILSIRFEDGIIATFTIEIDSLGREIYDYTEI